MYRPSGICPVPAACATADAAQGRKNLSIGQVQGRRTDDVISQELFAELAAMYAVNPTFMKENLPNAAAYIDAIVREQRQQTRSRARGLSRNGRVPLGTGRRSGTGSNGTRGTGKPAAKPAGKPKPKPKVTPLPPAKSTNQDDDNGIADPSDPVVRTPVVLSYPPLVGQFLA